MKNHGRKADRGRLIISTSRLKGMRAWQAGSRALRCPVPPRHAHAPPRSQEEWRKRQKEASRREARADCAARPGLVRGEGGRARGREAHEAGRGGADSADLLAPRGPAALNGGQSVAPHVHDPGEENLRFNLVPQPLLPSPHSIPPPLRPTQPDVVCVKKRRIDIRRAKKDVSPIRLHAGRYSLLIRRYRYVIVTRPRPTSLLRDPPQQRESEMLRGMGCDEAKFKALLLLLLIANKASPRVVSTTGVVRGKALLPSPQFPIHLAGTLAR